MIEVGARAQKEEEVEAEKQVITGIEVIGEAGAEIEKVERGIEEKDEGAEVGAGPLQGRAADGINVNEAALAGAHHLNGLLANGAGPITYRWVLVKTALSPLHHHMDTTIVTARVNPS